MKNKKVRQYRSNQGRSPRQQKSNETAAFISFDRLINNAFSNRSHIKCMANKRGSKRLRNNKARLLKFLRYTNKLTAYQKVASRIGYFGAAFFDSRTMDIRTKIIYYRFYMCNDTNVI